jgi:PAS domain S-box-containing protein
MQEIVKVNLDNEMDLILANKRTMKLAELCGLSLPSQTTFATAVSEIARLAISQGKKSYLTLSIHTPRPNKKEIMASIFDLVDLSKSNNEAFSYASRLSGIIDTFKEGEWHEIRLKHLINFGGTISPARIENFKEYFKNEPPLSPYDEIRKKNIQLIDLADKLQASENQYQVLTDTLPLLMFAVNNKGEITYANKGLKDFLGAQNAPFAYVAWPTMLHDEDYRKISGEWEKAVAGRKPFRAEGRLKHQHHYIWHLISMVPVKNDKDTVLSWIGFFVDIEAQKQIEETLKDNKGLKIAQLKLEQYQLELEDKISQLNISNDNLKQFAYIASHDLQEPLRKISTYHSMLQKKGELNEQQKYLFDKMGESAERMSNLINNVLEYSRLANPGDSFETVDLNELVANVLIDFELLKEEKGAHIFVSALPLVKGIPLQLSQLFSNLLSNSLKFSKEDPVVEISARLLPQEEASRNSTLNAGMSYYEISVRDNGIGFEQEYTEQIFVIFQRLTNDRKTGTGIGLALCKKIVENHGGALFAEGMPGKGAVFTILLPAL